DGRRGAGRGRPLRGGEGKLVHREGPHGSVACSLFKVRALPAGGSAGSRPGSAGESLTGGGGFGPPQPHRAKSRDFSEGAHGGNRGSPVSENDESRGRNRGARPGGDPWSVRPGAGHVADLPPPDPCPVHARAPA